MPCLPSTTATCAGIVEVIVIVEVLVVVVVVAVEEELFFGNLNSGPTEGDAEPPHHFHFEQRDEGKLIAQLNLSDLGFYLCSFVFHDKAKRTQQENLLDEGRFTISP